MIYPEFKILDRPVGYLYDPLIIAELGINHGGSLEIAKKMVNLAVKAGVDVIKHQTHIVDDEMSQEAKKLNVGYIGETIYSLMKNCSLTESEEEYLMNYTLDKGCIFLSTPFSRAAADRLEKFQVPAFKIGSGECNNFPLIEHISKFGKPIIMSTGMNNISTIKKSVSIIQSQNIPYALLHTTNIYPTPDNLVRLGAMTELQNEFPNAVIGLSDHTLTNHACFGAVALGASILERHFTDTLSRKGPDISNSMDFNSAKDLVDGSNILKLQRGGTKSVIDEEKPVIDFAYSSVVSIKTIQKGEIFSLKNIWVKRPGSGPLYAEDFENIIGKRANKNIENDQHISLDDIQ